MDSRFKQPWATNKHKERMDVMKEDERVFLRGINALVTNKEMWVNPISKEKLIMFSTKIWQKSNGEWRLVHVHSGDGSQVEVHPNGQMKRGWRAGREGGREGGSGLEKEAKREGKAMLGVCFNLTSNHARARCWLHGRASITRESHFSWHVPLPLPQCPKAAGAWASSNSFPLPARVLQGDGRRRGSRKWGVSWGAF